MTRVQSFSGAILSRMSCLQCHLRDRGALPSGKEGQSKTRIFTAFLALMTVLCLSTSLPESYKNGVVIFFPIQHSTLPQNISLTKPIFKSQPSSHIGSKIIISRENSFSQHALLHYLFGSARSSGCCTKRTLDRAFQPSRGLWAGTPEHRPGQPLGKLSIALFCLPINAINASLEKPASHRQANQVTIKTRSLGSRANLPARPHRFSAP